MAKTPKDKAASSDATVFVPRGAAEPSAPTGRIAIGSMLNHIYEVRRLIARGGMGEVYEGINVNTDERVAIKVILSQLAEDPKVLQMFRREAQTLTRLSHRALVQYRVLAQEPTLGVLYIVTEYIDGVGLNELIGQIQPTEEDLLRLTRRLADGLGAAHELGAIHRDMSPDNVLLPEGRLENAKIIDFGIAKDLEASQATIIGDGFAGKLAFVAPEQFGDYGREIGPWTDVYSLGLVILAVAAGKTVDMGTTLVEAVDRRRAGPDLSPLPSSIRPIFARMLEADPKKRFRSMAEVVAAIDALHSPPADHGAPHGRPPTLLLAAAGAAVVGLVAFAIVLLVTPSKNNGAGPTSAAVQTAMDTAVRGVSCSWLSDRVSQTSAGVQVQLLGAASDPSAAAAQVTLALAKTGAKIAGVDGSQVKPLPPAACDMINAVSQLRAPLEAPVWVQPAAASFAAQPNALCSNDPMQAVSVVTLTPPSGQGDVALFRVDDTGGLTRVFSGLSDFKSAAAVTGKGYLLEDLGAKGLRVSLCEKSSGLKGALVVAGKPPFDLGLASITGGLADPSANLAAQFTATGKAQGWKTQVAWYEVTGASAAPALSSTSESSGSSAPAPTHHHKAAESEGGAPAPAAPSGGGGGGSSPVF